MIKCEYYMTRSDGVVLVKTYSDSNKYIQQNETGIEYDVAVDVAVLEGSVYTPKYYTYTETDKIIEREIYE